MKKRIVIFLSIVIALINVALVGSKNNTQIVELVNIVNINSANAESTNNYDCQSVPAEIRYIYNDGETAGIAYRYKCEGSSGPCCEGWVVSYYEINHGGTSSPEYTGDNRGHTRC